MSYFKRNAIIGTALLLLSIVGIKAEPIPPSAPSQVAKPDTKVQGDLVNLRADAYWDTPGVPLLRLTRALKDYPHARRFRVSWSLLVFMNGSDTTILYDRREHSVTVYSTGGGDVIGAYRDHVRFTHVPEAVFTKIAMSHRNDRDDSEVWSWFSDLSHFGYPKRDLGSWHKDPS